MEFVLFLIAEDELAEGFVGEVASRGILQQIGRLEIIATLVIAVGEFDAGKAAVTTYVGLLEVFQGFEGVGLLHQAIACLYQHGEGICDDGLHDLLLRRNLALGGENRHKGEE